MGTVRHTDAIAVVLEASGIRAVFGKALMDQGERVPTGLVETPRAALDEALALAKRWHGAAGGRLSRVARAALRALVQRSAVARRRRRIGRARTASIHTHVAESPTEGREVESAVGTTAARYFASRGVLSSRFVGAHGVWLAPDECETLHAADAALVHCPGSNLKLGSGFANVRRWKDARIRCGLGSDGAACNNRLDTFHEMSLAAGVSRALEPGRPLSAREVLELATCSRRRGARPRRRDRLARARQGRRT